MTFEDWYETHFGDRPSTDVIDESGPRLDYSPTGDPVEEAIGSVFQAVREAPGKIAKKVWHGATRRDLPPPPQGFNPPWSFQRAVQNFPRQIPELYNQVKQNVLPPGFDVRRGIDSALGPAKWLFNEARQGVLPDEAIEEIKRDPYSVNSLGAYLNAGISLSSGKGGERIPLGPKGAVPEHIWQSWKIPNPDNPTLRVDNAGNHFQMTGIHKVGEPGDPGHAWHAIVEPVEPPGTAPEPTSQEKFAEDWTKFSEENKKQYPELYPPEQQQQPPPEPGGLWDEWAKKHGGLKPDFEAPPPYASEHPVTPEDLADFYAKHGEPMPPSKPEGYWGNLNDPKYYDRSMSGPLKGQQWADIYATPDMEFTVGPNNPNIDPPIPPQVSKAGWEWWDGLQKGDVTREQYDAAMDAIRKGELPPLPPELPPPPDIDPGIIEDFNNISKWQEKRRKENYQMNRWKWKPGGENL
jgi:hypothetical protein